MGREIPCLFLVFFVALAEGFLGRGTYLPDHGDVFHIYCKDFNASSTEIWHHEDIITEAFKRVLIKGYLVSDSNSSKYQILTNFFSFE